jgi:AcrR family transcriptional regulator
LDFLRAPIYREGVPGDTLTRDQIVEAAIELLDREGLEGLNMRALGKRLGSAPTAVYWHVGSKWELVTLVGDHMWNEIALPDLASTDWRTAAASVATDLRAMLIRHPWWLQVFGSYAVYGPGKSRHDDHNLAIYEAAGFSGAAAEQAATAVFMFVLGSALGIAAEAALKRKLSREGGDADARVRESLARAGEIASQFPRLRARMGGVSSSYGGAHESTFELGLQAILDGLEAQLAEGRAPVGARDARVQASE